MIGRIVVALMLSSSLAVAQVDLPRAGVRDAVLERVELRFTPTAEDGQPGAPITRRIEVVEVPVDGPPPDVVTPEAQGTVDTLDIFDRPPPSRTRGPANPGSSGPSAFRRHYRELRSVGEGDPEFVGALEGARVSLAVDRPGSSLVRELSGTTVAADRVPSLGLEELLADSVVLDGEGWSIDPSVALQALVPFGGAHALGARRPAADGSLDSFLAALDAQDPATGSAAATFVELRGAAPNVVAAIAIDLDVARGGVRIQGGAELLWDVGLARVASLDFSATVTGSRACGVPSGVLAVQAATRDAYELEYSPRPGTVVERTIETHVRNRSYETNQWIDGESVVGRELISQYDCLEQLAVVDVYSAFGMRRFFAKLGHDLVVGHEERQRSGRLEARGHSPLVGRTVEFSRDRAGNLGTPRLAHGAESQEALLSAALAKLSRDPDGRALLPNELVAVGDSWSIEPQAAIAALLPAGALGIAYTELAREGALALAAPDWFASLPLVLSGEVAGEVEARLRGVESVGERLIALIDLELSLEVVTDVTEHFASHPPTDGSGSYSTESAESAWGFSGTGLLRWDLYERRPVGSNITGEIDAQFDFHFVTGSSDVESQQDIRGELSVQVTVE